MGALGGVATAVCGASAALATATVDPDYRGKAADIAFAVVAMNALATVAMLAYPLLCVWLGLTEQQTGVSSARPSTMSPRSSAPASRFPDRAANAAVIVKLFRVFLLLPSVLVVGWWMTRHGGEHGAAKVPVPVFAIVFLILCPW